MKIEVDLTPQESTDLLLMLGVASGFLAGSGGLTDGSLNRCLTLVNKLNAQNPGFRPYELLKK